MSAVEGVHFLGTRFDTASLDDAARNILAEMHGPFRYVITPNVHHMVRLAEDRAVMQPLFDSAWRIYCDSRVLARLARLTGVNLSVVPGSDLTARLIELASDRRLAVALVGPTAEACATLKRKYPGLDIRSYTPPMGFIRDATEVQKCVDFVVTANAPLMFLAVGMPQQEILARRLANLPDASGIGLCIGASIDFLTGKQKRAPVLMQKAGLEWLHRLLSDPRRLARRYLVECPRIFYLAWSTRGRG